MQSSGAEDLDLPGPTQPLSEDRLDYCPLCGAILIPCVATYEEESYDAFRCPNECDLAEHYS